MADQIYYETGDTITEASLVAALDRPQLTDYVATGLGLTADYGVPDVDVASGRAFIGGYTVEADARTGVALTDSTVNYVYLVYDPSVDESVSITVNTTGSDPADPSLLLGTVDTGADTTTEENRTPNFDGDHSGTFDGELVSTTGDHAGSVTGSLTNTTGTHSGNFDGVLSGAVDAQSNDITNVGSIDAATVLSRLEQATARISVDAGTVEAVDKDGVIDSDTDAATVYASVLSNISSGDSVAWYPGTYSWNQEVTQTKGNVPWITAGLTVNLSADTAITNFLTLRDAGSVIGTGPQIDGVRVNGNGNADRFLNIDTVRFGHLSSIKATGLNTELLEAYSDQAGNNTDNWTAEDIQVSGSRFGTLRAGSSARADDWDIDHCYAGGVPASDWGLILQDTHNHSVKNFFAGNNSGTAIAGGVKVESPGANAGASDPMTGIEMKHIGMENTGVATSAVTVLLDGAGNRLQECVVEGLKCVGSGVTPVQFANSGGTIRRNRGNVARDFLTDQQPVAVVDADVYRAKVEVHRQTGNDTNPLVTDNGDFTTVNNHGREAAGSGNSPSSTHWDTGAIVENTDDSTVHMKIGPSTWAQLA